MAPPPSENFFHCFLTLLFQEILRMPPKEKLTTREVADMLERSDSSSSPEPSPKKLARCVDLDDTMAETSQVQKSFTIDQLKS